MTRVWEELNLLLGKAPNCNWVQVRLAAYEAWDLSLTPREFTVIHEHVHDCPVCAREYEQTVELVSLLRVASGHAQQTQIDPEAIADRVLAEISSRGLRRASWQDRVTGPFALAAKKLGFLWKGSGETVLFPKRKVSPERRPRRFKAATVVAVACAVLMAMPVLAYVGQEVLGVLGGSSDTQVASSDTSESQVPSTLSDDQSALGNSDAPTGTDALEAIAISLTTDNTLSALLDKETEEAEARVFVESLLPHTEQEYEAWAREEYPHIMWLYDVLMGEMTEKPANSPAGRLVSFGTSDAGNPTITLHDTDGNAVTLCVLLSIDAVTEMAPTEFTTPDETGLSPSTTSYVILNPASIPWDGIPANIPEWAQRLYADTPESERPIGWRALFIYSGEIFKFDWPESLDDPNCAPTAEAVQAIAAVSGVALDGRVALRTTGASSSQDGMDPEPAPDYIDALAKDIPRAKSVVCYVDVSAFLVGTPEFLELSDCAGTVLGALRSAPGAECTASPFAEALVNLLDSRKRSISRAEWAVGCRGVQEEGVD